MVSTLALTQFHLDAVMTATDNPAWATDLIYGDHFLFGTSGLAAPGDIRSSRCRQEMVFGTPVGISFFGTAFSEPNAHQAGVGLRSGHADSQEQPADLQPDGAVRSHRRHHAQRTEEPDGASGAEPGPAAGRASASHARADQGQEAGAPVVIAIGSEKRFTTEARRTPRRIWFLRVLIRPFYSGPAV